MDGGNVESRLLWFVQALLDGGRVGVSRDRLIDDCAMIPVGGTQSL